MRGLIKELKPAHPLGHMLPALYQEDDLTQRFTGALDDVLSPVVSTLDSLDAYLDPALAPGDFVAWLGGWVGVIAGDAGPLVRQRALVAEAATIYRWRGTRKGLAVLIRHYFGVEPEIEESGGVHWTPYPDGLPPAAGPPVLLVRLRVPNPEAVNVRRLDALVAAAKPAHIPHRVDVTT
jgi:phage tail-like protein